MITTEVTKTTVHRLTKQQVTDLIVHALEADRYAKGMVSVTFDVSGGDDGYGGWNAMDLNSAKVTITEKTAS